MPDREKVVKGLESCATGKCEISCPYHNVPQCTRAILTDALALLKEQEEKRTPKPIIHGHKEEYWGEEEICPDCGKKWQSEIIDTTHFCPGCGRSVKWYG